MYNNSSAFRISCFRNRVLAWIILITFLHSFVPSLSFAQQPTAKISVLSGTVLVNGQEKAEGTMLTAGDVIETKAWAFVVLELSDGSQLELGENTKLDLKVLSQSAKGARASHLKVWWGRIRAKLSPGHQQEGAIFDIETPNAIIGVKFSQPDVEVSYEPETDKTIAVAHTVALAITNLLTGEEVLISVGATAIVTALGIEVIGTPATGAIGAKTGKTGTQEPPTPEPEEPPKPEPRKPEAPEPEVPEPKPTGAETGTAVGGATGGGLSATTLVILGVGAAAAVAGAVVLAGGGDNEESIPEIPGWCSQTQSSGGDTPEIRVIEMGRTSGTFQFYYDMESVRDRMTVEYEGRILHDTSCVSGSRTINLSYGGSSTTVSVRVTPNCAGTTSTRWSFIVYCPQ